jgi:hypothetical protein
MTLDIDDSETVENLKKGVLESGQVPTTMPLHRYRLFEGANELSDETQLHSCFPAGNDQRSLHLVLRWARETRLPQVLGDVAPEVVFGEGKCLLQPEIHFRAPVKMAMEIRSVCDECVPGEVLWNPGVYKQVYLPQKMLKGCRTALCAVFELVSIRLQGTTCLGFVLVSLCSLTCAI